MSIIIKQISARLTNDQQIFGNMSPYVNFTIGNQLRKTSVRDNAGKTPNWPDTITFQGRDNNLFIQVYDKDVVNDDLVGTALVPLNKYYSMPNVPQKQQFQLQYHSKSAGRIMFTIQFQSLGNNNQNWQNPNINPQIPNNPWMQPNQGWGNQNPNWNSNQFNKGWNNSNQNQSYNIPNQNQGYNIPNQNWNNNNGWGQPNQGWGGQQNFNQWGNIQPPINNPNIQPLSFNPLQVIINKTTQTQQQQMPSFQQPLQSNNLYPGMRIIVKPLQGSFTRDLDTFTKMDPFCQVSLGNQLKRTNTAIGAGQTPHWYDSLEFIFANDKILRLTVYDEDISSNDMIGIGTLDLQNMMYNNQGPVRKQSVNIICNGKHAGKVLLSIQIYPPNNQYNNNGW